MPIRPIRAAALQPSSNPTRSSKSVSSGAVPVPRRRVRQLAVAAEGEALDSLAAQGRAKLKKLARRGDQKQSRPEMPDDYVGKWYPPKAHRWKKGQSGNPSGKKGKGPQPVKNTDTYVLEILGQPVPVNTAAGERHMNAVQIALSKAREQAAKGNMNAIRLILDVWGKAAPAGPRGELVEGSNRLALDEVEQGMIDDLLGMLESKAAQLTRSDEVDHGSDDPETADEDGEE